MRQRDVLFSLLLIVLLTITFAGCKKQSPEITPVDTAPETAPAPPPPEPPKTEVEPPGFEGDSLDDGELEDPIDLSIEEINRQGLLRTIFFALDSSQLSPLARQTLRTNAEWLKAHPELGVVIEGHCDERGSIEYNLALGQRRASSVRDYLVTLGVDRPRVRTVSYGEEQPVDRAHDEAAWSQNRRAQFRAE